MPKLGPRNLLDRGIRRPMKKILGLENPHAAVPISGDRKCVSTMNTRNRHKSVALEIEQAFVGRNPQSSFIVAPQRVNRANQSTICDFVCGPTDAELCFIPGAVFAQRAFAAIESNTGICQRFNPSPAPVQMLLSEVACTRAAAGVERPWVRGMVGAGESRNRSRTHGG